MIQLVFIVFTLLGLKLKFIIMQNIVSFLTWYINNIKIANLFYINLVWFK